MAFPDNTKYLIMLYCLLKEGLRITLQSLFSIPELLKFVEVLVQDVHLRRAHPRHPLTARKHHSGRLKPSLRAPTWATDTHLFVAQLSSHILETQLSHPVGDLDAGRLVLDWLLPVGCRPRPLHQRCEQQARAQRAKRTRTNYSGHSASLSIVH